ncbi:monosaccharide ABC transporter membrane protein, CUT2 family [Rhizobiales bacterium GAS191]|nr:monosaccharide ABC transporter membrane protein, CUT2 family [Rhizobiales bacterium GAS191]
MLDVVTRLRRRTEFWLLLVIVLLCGSLSFTTDSFLTLRNLSDLLTSNAFTGILCAGLLVVLISGGIDISFTASASVAQYVALSIANAYGANWVTLFLLAGSVGTVCGLANAVVIHRFGIKSIIVTIATLNIFYGLLIFVTSGKYIYNLPDWFAAGISWFEFTDKEDITYSINLQILVLIVCFLLTFILLARTNIGRQIYAMGGNPDAAQRLGFHIFRLHLVVYGYMGLMAGIASLVQAQLAQSVAPTVLVGKELDVLAAVVLGGASLNGGVGTVFGTILGLVLLALMQNGLVLVGVSSYWLQFLIGIVILIAVSFTAVQSRSSASQRRAPA